MKLFSDCAGNCCICKCGDSNCLSGIGDNNYVKATKEQVVNRFFGYKTFSDYKRKMIQYLKEEYHLSDSQILDELISCKYDNKEESKRVSLTNNSETYASPTVCLFCKHQNPSGKMCILGAQLECNGKNYFELMDMNFLKHIPVKHDIESMFLLNIENLRTRDDDKQ